MYFGKKQYTLIDVEEGKQMIDCADFIMPMYNGAIRYTTACWRGYTAKYYVIRKILYGTKSHDIFAKCSKFKKITSLRTIIPYTGSCIIAYGGGWNSDFIQSYLDYGEALELYFEQGVLKDKLSLISAIEKARAISKTAEYNKRKPCERGSLRKQIAREPLKYRYDENTYKWRKKTVDIA